MAPEHGAVLLTRTIASVFLLPTAFVPPGARPADAQLVFAPRPDVELHKRFDFDLKLRCARFELDGTNLALSDLRVRLDSSVRSIDRYAIVERGAPRELLRRFDALSGRWWIGDSPSYMSGFDRLTGTEVCFAWDEQLGEFARTPIGDAPRWSLACLAEDMDLRGLLPSEAVAVGARWIASGPGVIDALWASTELGLCAATEAEIYEQLVQQVLLPPLRSLAAEKLRIECDWVGESPTRGRDVQRIALRVDERIECDLTEVAQRSVRAANPVDRPSPRERLTTRWELAGKGALDWNVRDGHFANFELVLDVALEVNCELRIGGEDVLVEMSWVGSAEWSSCAESRSQK